MPRLGFLVMGRMEGCSTGKNPCFGNRNKYQKLHMQKGGSTLWQKNSQEKRL